VPNGKSKLLVMRKLFLFTLFLFSCSIFSQSKISRSELLKAERITDLVKDIPVDCKVTSYVFKITRYKEVKGKTEKTEKTDKLKCVGNELRLDMQDLFKASDKGDKFSFEKLETACLEKHKKKYSFEIKE